jgi:hypothetical protein
VRRGGDLKSHAMIHLEKADNEGSKLYYSRKKIDTGAAVATPDCETAVLV